MKIEKNRVENFRKVAICISIVSLLVGSGFTILFGMDFAFPKHFAIIDGELKKVLNIPSFRDFGLREWGAISIIFFCIIILWAIFVISIKFPELAGILWLLISLLLMLPLPFSISIFDRNDLFLLISCVLSLNLSILNLVRYRKS